MESLNKIQDDARFFAKFKSLDLTAGDGLRNASYIYRGMASPDFTFFGQKIGRRWPEFSIEDSTITTVADQEQYKWPVDPAFLEEPFIELLDASSSNYPYPLLPVPNMQVWSDYDDSNSGVPVYYRRLWSGDEVKLALRPNPDTAGDTIRISGTVEAVDFTDGESKTIFLNKNSDRALAIFIAALYREHQGHPGEAAQLVADGIALLPKFDYAPTLRPRGFLQSWPV